MSLNSKFSSLLLALCWVYPWLTLAHKGTIEDVEHVVLFMQENRSWDHYFGSMAGVRGFADPNVHVVNGREVWYQQVDRSLSNATTELLPFYINAAGGDLFEATQCMVAGSNGWTANHKALNHGGNNRWVSENTPYSWGHFLRPDIPFHFGLADAYTVADMYHEGMTASTDPNRAFWISGSANVPGGPQTPDQGGPATDNNVTPGCESKNPNVNCFPYKWKTFPEILEDEGVSWQVVMLFQFSECYGIDVYITQDVNNFGDDPLAWFEQFINAPANSSLAKKGMAFIGLQSFYDAAAAGTLPQVSYIIAPAELSEHPPFLPRDGAWLQQQVVNAVVNSPKYNSTILMISYDEEGGLGDHVVPTSAPPNTPGEWMLDPFNKSEGIVPAGPGARLPFTAISPWSRNGGVFTALSDHSSQIMFLEKWLAAKGFDVKTDQLNDWRRNHMSDLTQMFDFAHPDYTKPVLPQVSPPLTNSKGQCIGTSNCQAKFPNPQPPIPYGNQTRESSLQIETGFKKVRGALTEGRYLVFEAGGHALALSQDRKGLGVSRSVESHDTQTQRFILQATQPPPATTFNLQFESKNSGIYVGHGLKTTTSISHALTFEIRDLGSGRGHTVRDVSSGKFLSIAQNGNLVVLGGDQAAFSVFSVTKKEDSGSGF